MRIKYYIIVYKRKYKDYKDLFFKYIRNSNIF